MNISEIMSKNVVTVGLDDTLREVKKIFDNTRFHHLLVVEDDGLIGVISDRDLLKSISPNVGTLAESADDEATLNKRVHQIMTRKLITLNDKATIKDAVALFNSSHISCIPIIDNKREAVGILSWRDILKAFK